jgi:hypothetical protein
MPRHDDGQCPSQDHEGRTGLNGVVGSHRFFAARRTGRSTQAREQTWFPPRPSAGQKCSLHAREPRPICCVQRTWSPEWSTRVLRALTYDRSNERAFWTGAKTTQQAESLGGRRPVTSPARPCHGEGAGRRAAPTAKDQAAKQIASLTRRDSSRVGRMCSVGGGNR